MENKQNEELIKEQKKKGGVRKSTGFLVLVAGTIIFFIESINDIFMRDFYGDMEVFGIQYTPEIVSVMAVVGIVLSVFVAFFLFFILKKSSHYVILLIISGISLFAAFAFIGPVVLIIGSIIGIKDKKTNNL